MNPIDRITELEKLYADLDDRIKALVVQPHDSDGSPERRTRNLPRRLSDQHRAVIDLVLGYLTGEGQSFTLEAFFQTAQSYDPTFPVRSTWSTYSVIHVFAERAGLKVIWRKKQ